MILTNLKFIERILDKDVLTKDDRRLLVRWYWDRKYDPRASVRRMRDSIYTKLGWKRY